MEHVNFSDINTDDGKVKVINDIIDNLNLSESKIFVLDKTVARKSWVGKLINSLNKDKKGDEK